MTADETLQQLVALVPPPPATGRGWGWDQIEEGLGRLPSDYKRLVETYGSGSFDDFLWLLVPGYDNPNVDLGRQAAAILDHLRELRAPEGGVPYDLRRDAPGLLPWAVTDNGETCFWDTASEDPDAWSIVVNEARGPAWVTFAGSATDFLLAVFAAKSPCALFPDDFPSPEPAFTPLRD